jgi:hypothetical protein
MTSAKPIFVPPEGNRSVEPTGNVGIRVSGIDIGGTVAVFEFQTKPDDGALLLSTTSKIGGSTLSKASTTSRYGDGPHTQIDSDGLRRTSVRRRR